jgi:hypothetical protein
MQDRRGEKSRQETGVFNILLAIAAGASGKTPGFSSLNKAWSLLDSVPLWQHD